MDQKKKGDGEKYHHPKAQPEFGAVIAQMVLCPAIDKIDIRKKQNERYRKEKNGPKDQPKERTSIMYPYLSRLHVYDYNAIYNYLP